jgi:single-stranded DNA-binding protein
MSSVGLNKWIVSGHLAADAEVKTVDLKTGEKAQVAEATLYVRKSRNWKESFTVKLSIWERSIAWRKLPYLKKGSVVICTGSVEPNPYISSNGNLPKAGLEMTVLDIDLDIVKNNEPDETSTPASVEADGNPFDTVAVNVLEEHAVVKA